MNNNLINLELNKTTFEKTVKWYKSYYENNKRFLTQEDLESYANDANESKNAPATLGTANLFVANEDKASSPICEVWVRLLLKKP